MDLLWTCKRCGKQFDTLSFAYALDMPDRWTELPKSEREQRGQLSSDACVIDGQEFYIRGRIVIPVRDSPTPFVWGVWTSIPQQGYDRIGETWNVEQREHEPPIAGTLANDIPIYPQTRDLRCSLHLRNAGKRPSIMLESTDHPLAVEQRNGITLDRVKEIAAVVLKHG